MGGPGSGRKPKKKLDPGEVISESGTTVMGEVPEEPKKKKKTPKKVKATQADYRNKIFMLFQALARLTKKECQYTEGDFTTEAAALVRITDKFPQVAYAINMLDPIFMFVSLVNKFGKMPAKKQEPKPQPKPTQGQGQTHPVPNIYNMQR